MDLGYSKTEIMKLLDQHLHDVTDSMQAQIDRTRKEKNNPEVSLATLLTSSMLSVLEAVSAVIDINNKKIHADLVSKGLIKKAKKTAKPKAKAAAKAAPKTSAKSSAKRKAKPQAKTAAKAKAK